MHNQITLKRYFKINAINNSVPAEEYRIKLLIENKLIICALGNLHYKVSREKFEPEPSNSGIRLKREI